jgi:hypothetical protein
MKAHTVDGREVEIPMDEAQRIHELMATAHETPDEYRERALMNIRKRAAQYGFKDVGDCEDDMKTLLAAGVERLDPELLGEVTEWFIANYNMKVRA